MMLSANDPGPTLNDEGFCRVVSIEAPSEQQAADCLAAWIKQHERFLTGSDVFAVINWPGGGLYQRVEVRDGRPDA